MSDLVMRSFTKSEKVFAVQRVLSGESLAAVAAELRLRRQLLYRWRDTYRDFGEAGLDRRRGPKPGRKAARMAEAALSSGPADPLAQAKARIAELEAKIGRQQMELDFFRHALRLTDAVALSPAPRSTRSST